MVSAQGGKQSNANADGTSAGNTKSMFWGMVIGSVVLAVAGLIWY